MRDLGLFLHPTVAVDAVRGGIIGLVGAQVLNRTATKVDASKRRAIEAKAARQPLRQVSLTGSPVGRQAICAMSPR